MTTMAMMRWLSPMAILMMMCFPAESTAIVATGQRVTCALNVGQGIKCWGLNRAGQLGYGHTSNLYEPQDSVIDLGDDFDPLDVKCGALHCCALSAIGSLKCWGYNHKGQLGYGDTDNRGDQEGQMGNNLPVVQLPTGFVADSLFLNYHSACVIGHINNVTEVEIVCFGANDDGQCGVGHSDNVGYEENQMGDMLISVDLGEGFEVVHLGGGGWNWCAVSTVGEVKCWGQNNMGQLGLGDTDKRGDEANEMGENLPALDLGDFYAEQVGCGNYHCCALAEGDLKCWGRNDYGQLGYEDITQRGRSASTMGENLPIVDLGTDFAVDDFSFNTFASCARSSGDVKCFGNNDYGQLGYGDKTDRGNSPGSMGDALSVVDIGSGFTETGLRIARNSGSGHHFCVFEELLLKCFGYNEFGQLGYGDIENRGDSSNEMGDDLDFVELNFTVIETTTGLPTTSAPTSVPTMFPSVSPTSVPTMFPSVSPTTGLPTTAAPTTMEPTKVPTVEPTKDPTVEPTKEPTMEPTKEPTVEPTPQPSSKPTMQPTVSPTVKPTAQPSDEPTMEPTPDCSVFHIDEFLMDCSDEFDAHDAHIDTLNSDVASIKETVSKLVNATTTTIASINAINAEIQAIMEQLDGMGDYP